MKTKKFSLSLLAIAVVNCAVMLFGMLLFNCIPVSVASAAEIQSENYDEYTDSDKLIGGTYTIRDYANKLHHSTVHWDGVTYTVTADDPIVQIVPRSLFANKGEYLHIGKEYGFFVKTTADDRDPNVSSIKPDPYNNSVEVLVFDITTGGEINDYYTPDLITVKVEPLFQYRYAYIDYRSDMFYSDENKPSSLTFGVPYSIADGTNFVVPKPLSTLSESFDQTWNYFLKDLSIAATLLNEQELNDLDYGYIAANDNGYFFIQSDYKYDGFVSLVSTENKLSVGLNVVSMISGAVSFVPGPVGKVAGVLGLLLGGGQTAASIAVMANDGSPVAGLSVDNGQITAENLFTTKRGQIENYRHPVTKKPCLTKNATCMIKGDDKNGNVWFRNGDHATAYFRVSHTQELLTRLEREIALTVVDKDGNEYKKNTTSQHKFTLNNPVYKSIDLDKKAELILLADGDNYFKFIAEYTSDYILEFDSENDAETYVMQQNMSNFKKLAKVDGRYSYRMNARTAHLIKVHSPNKAKLNIKISPSSTLSNISPYGDYMIKYVPEESGAYTLAADNAAFLIKSVYHNNHKGVYSTACYIDRPLDCADVDAVLKKDEVYYVVFTNNSAAEASGNLILTECSSMLSIGSNAPKTFIGGENYRYYKFELTDNRANVNFNFKGADINTDTVEFKAFDVNGNLIGNIESYYDGYLRLDNIYTGIYYIGVRVDSTTELAAEINKNTQLKIWKQLVDGVWQEINDGIIHHLKRGERYYFSFWVDNTVIRFYHIDRADERGFHLGNNFLLEIYPHAQDYDRVELEAVLHSSDGQNDMAYIKKLVFRPIFNLDKELTPVIIDYNNKINLYVQIPKDIKQWSYIILSNTENSSDITELDSSTIDRNIDKNYLSILCERKATYARLIITTICISGVDGSQRDLIINREYYINCKENWYDANTSSSYISNELHLYNMRYNTAANKVFTNDIYLNYFANWEIMLVNPAGTTINGNGCTITGMRFAVPTGSNQYYGFIAQNYGTIRNLNFTGVSITGKSSDKYGNMRFGTVAAINYGIIKYCKASGKIDVYRRDGVVGGIVAINNQNALVEDCVFGHVGGQNENYLGNSGDIGGIVGRNLGGSVQFCRTLNAIIGGDVDHCSNSYGGIVGYLEGGAIAACRVEGVHIKVTNGSLISGQYPSMSYVVGHIAGGAIVDSCVISGCSNNIKKLTVGYRKNCFNGTGGCYGVWNNGTVTNITVY